MKTKLETVAGAVLLIILAAACADGAPPPMPAVRAAEVLPPNVRRVSWDISPTNGTYFMLWGPSLNDMTNRFRTTGGTNSILITRSEGVRNYWAVVGVSGSTNDEVYSEKLFYEHRLPPAYEQKYIALVSDTFSGPRRPVATNTVTSLDPIRFLWGEGTSTIIP